MKRYKQNLIIRGNQVWSYSTHVATIAGNKLYQLAISFCIGLLLGMILNIIIQSIINFEIKSDRPLKPYKVEMENKNGEVYKTYYYKKQ